MIFKGRIKDVQREWRTNTLLITVSVLEGEIDELQDLTDKDLTVTLKKFSKKRSLNANAYLWVLLSKISAKVQNTAEDLYKGFIQDICLPVEIDGIPIVVTVKSEVDMEKIPGYWHFLKESPDRRFTSYIQLRGSSDFNKEEFARLLDMVIAEAKEVGVETLTPSEIERLKETWRQNEKIHNYE